MLLATAPYHPFLFFGVGVGYNQDSRRVSLVRDTLVNSHVYLYGAHEWSFSLPCANIVHGTYRYTADLQALASRVASSPYPWTRYHSPINMERLCLFLDSHPDQRFAAIMRDGLRQGFRIDFDRQQSQLRSRRRNHPSASTNPTIVDERLAAELQAGRLLGPLTPRAAGLVHTSPSGLVPKVRQLGKFRLIVDLSNPERGSVNDGISEDLCTIRYSSVDDAVAIIQSLGPNTLLAKLDLKDAYRIVPVHQQDYHLLGIAWRGEVFIDRALPFGLRSAPKLFSAVSDLIAWVLHQQGVSFQLHYLDDFLFLGPPGTSCADQAFSVALKTLHELDIPVALHKCAGPATVLEFLGILVDSSASQLRLPAEKLVLVQGLDLEILLPQEGPGELPGPPVPRGYSGEAGKNLSERTVCSFSSGPQGIRLNSKAKADILWWHIFLQSWNGSSFFSYGFGWLYRL